MGTFKLRPVSVFSKTGTWTVSPGGATSNAALVAALNGSGVISDNNSGLASDAQLRVLTKYYLDGSGTPTEIGGLPAGFRLLTAVATVTTGAFDTAGDPLIEGHLQFLDSQESPNFAGGAGAKTFAYPGAMPSPTDLYNDGLGMHYIVHGSAGTPTWDDLAIDGTYDLQAWWYSESLDDWEFGADPGGDYAPADAPTPRIDSIVPDQGPTAGGTAVTITGGGFFNPDGTLGVESVIFDGEFPGTDVVVIDEHTLTCVTPAHWKSTKHVVVNLDFAP